MHRLLKITLHIGLLGALLFGTRLIHARYAADECLSDAEKLLESGEYSRALIYADKAINLNPMEPNYYRNRARIYLSLSLLSDESNSLTYKLLALEDMKEAYRLNPNNLVTVRNLIPLYYFLAVTDLGEEDNKLIPDKNFLGITETFYSKVENISPNDVGVYVLLYRYSGRLELMDLHKRSEEKIGELRGDLFDWYTMLE